VELPEYMSQSHEIFVFKNTTNSNGDGLIQAELTLPVHLRYHQPTADGDFLSVSLQPPIVLLQCATCMYRLCAVGEGKCMGLVKVPLDRALPSSYKYQISKKVFSALPTQTGLAMHYRSHRT